MSVIRRNIFWLLVSQVATWFATLATLVVVPNRLGSTDFGTYGYATGYVQFFTLVAGLGTSTYLSRAIARDYSLMGSYVWNSILLKFALWTGLSAIAMGLAYALGNRGETLLVIGITCVGMLPYILNEVFFGALAGMQRMARPAMWMVVQVYFQTIFGVLVLLLGWGLVAYTAVMAMGTIIPMVATALMVRPFLRGHRVFDFSVWRLLVVGGVPLLALTFFNLIYGTLDVPILHALSGSDPVGWYVVAMKWVSIPVFITTAVVSAYFPVFSKHGQPVTEEFGRLVNQAVQIVLVITIPASVGLFFIADDLIHFVYDSEYDSAISLVQILAFGLPIMSMDTVLATALVASNRLSRYLWVAGAAAVLNPFLCVVAIKLTDAHYGNGAIGTAIVTVVTEVWVMGGALYFRSPGVVDRAETGRILRIVLASAAMAPVMMLTAHLPLAVQVVAGLVVYAIALLAFGGISVAEARDAIQQVKRSRRQDDDGEGDDDGLGDAAGLDVPIGPELAPFGPDGEIHPR